VSAAFTSLKYFFRDDEKKARQSGELRCEPAAFASGVGRHSGCCSPSFLTSALARSTIKSGASSIVGPTLSGSAIPSDWNLGPHVGLGHDPARAGDFGRTPRIPVGSASPARPVGGRADRSGTAGRAAARAGRGGGRDRQAGLGGRRRGTQSGRLRLLSSAVLTLPFAAAIHAVVRRGGLILVRAHRLQESPETQGRGPCSPALSLRPASETIDSFLMSQVHWDEKVRRDGL